MQTERREAFLKKPNHTEFAERTGDLVNMNVLYCVKGHYIGIAQHSRQVRSFSQIDAIASRLARDEAQLPAFCPKCGAKNISTCPHCQAPILHRFAGDSVAYCGGCGQPFPWTEAALTAAKEYTDELDELTPQEKTTLKASFDDLTTDTAQTPLAASRFKRIMSKVGTQAATAIQSIMVNVMTSEVRKHLGLPPS